MASSTHLVVLPSYDTGPRLADVVSGALRHWQPVLVVIDGSTDGSERTLRDMQAREAGLWLTALPRNSGKGAAVLAGLKLAAERGFSHALVMDSDGQHPEAEIAPFMEASRLQPDAMILGTPIFGPEVPIERLHGRKISTFLSKIETLGPAIGDPLFGFRVYPIKPLLAVLAAPGRGRRYDFDTEAAVRLCWAGVRPVNVPAPVRYFSRSEGGVSHFRYTRDNLVLARMHARLIFEAIFVRWRAIRRHRRLWTAVAAFALATAAARPNPAPVAAIRPISPSDPAWSELAGGLRDQGAVTADFTESRWFPFKTKPVVLHGEVRVSARLGLSLHYDGAEGRTVVIDDRGLLIRSPAGDSAPPADRRAEAADSALLQVLRLNLASLGESFDLYGSRTGDSWRLELSPKDGEVRRSLGRIAIEGEGTSVRRIEFRRSAVQKVDIVIGPPRIAAAFTAADRSRYFRAP